METKRPREPSTDSYGYPASTHGYRRGAGSPTSEPDTSQRDAEPPDAEGPDAEPSDAEPSDAEGPDAGESWVSRQGFNSVEEFLDDLARNLNPFDPDYVPYRPREVPAGSTPEADVPVRGRTPSRYVRQVNIKLSPECFEELEELAARFGVSTSAMARMLVNRNILLARERGEI